MPGQRLELPDALNLFMRPFVYWVWCVATISLAAPQLAADEPRPLVPPSQTASELEYQQIVVEPAAIELRGPLAYQQLVVTARLASGDRIDVTRAARWGDPRSLLEISPSGLVLPRQDGKTQLKVTVGSHHVRVPAVVNGVSERPRPNFIQDVSPVFSRLGCNAGTCHGSREGKGGLQLSLRGYDAEFDHRVLTDDIAARRLNRADPDQSLMLLKSAGLIPHEGGALMQAGDRYYQILRHWIADGARLDLRAPSVKSIAVTPHTVAVPRAKISQQFRVVAKFSDGALRDVTAESFFESSDLEILSVTQSGLVTAQRRGEAAVLVRYQGSHAAVQVAVMGDRSGWSWKDVPAFNYIDASIYKKQRRVKTLPSGVCTDADFLRRAYLDLTGLPPDAKEVRRFLADESDQRAKREALVDRLIGSPAFLEHWTNNWADLLQVNPKFLGADGAQALRDWIRRQLENNTPYDRFVYDIITAAGSNVGNPPAAYYKILRTPEQAVENTTQLFLGVRFSCNKCHDHPFERWTQDDYYRLAAFFAQIGRTADPRYGNQTIGGTAVMEPQPLVETITDLQQGEIINERTGQSANARFPFDVDDEPRLTGTRREQLARWLVSPRNPYFAKSFVNRIWSYLTGLGLIEPVDDLRASNPPSNPELLETMTAKFVASGFDVRELMASICKSRTYQLAVATNRWNEDDRANYTHAVARRLPAAVLYDAIHRATGTPSHLPGLPPGSRAAAIIDPGAKLPDGFLDAFGRAPRESACECERSSDMMLSSVMNLISGPTINNAVMDPTNRIARLVAEYKDDRNVVSELYLSILNRPATDTEIDAAIAAMRVQIDDYGLDKLEQNLARLEQQLDAEQTEWEKTVLPPVWHTLVPQDLQSEAGATLTVEKDGVVFVSGDRNKDTYVIRSKTRHTGITGFRLEVLADERLPQGGPGRAKNGNFVLNEFVVLAGSAAASIKLQNAQADFSMKDYDVSAAIDGDQRSGWAIGPEMGTNHFAIFETAEVVRGGASHEVVCRLVQQYKDKKHAIGKFRLSVTTSPRPFSLNGPPEAIAPIVKLPADERTPTQKQALREFFRAGKPDYQDLRAEVDRLKQVVENPRLAAAQDLAWALLNSPAFLFNR